MNKRQTLTMALVVVAALAMVALVGFLVMGSTSNQPTERGFTQACGKGDWEAVRFESAGTEAMATSAGEACYGRWNGSEWLIRKETNQWPDEQSFLDQCVRATDGVVLIWDLLDFDEDGQAGLAFAPDTGETCFGFWQSNGSWGIEVY